MRRKSCWLLLGLPVLGVTFCLRPLVGQPPEPEPAFTDQTGAYTVRVVEIAKIRRFVPEGEDELLLRVQLALETDQPVLGCQFLPLTAATDDTGVSLLQEGRPGWHAPFILIPRFRTPIQHTFTLLPPAEGALALKELKGSLKVALSTGTEEIRFENPTEKQGVTQEKEGTKVTLKSAKWEGKTFSAEVEVERPEAVRRVTGRGQVEFRGGGALIIAFQRRLRLMSRLEFGLVDAQGTERMPNSLGGGGGRKMHYRLRWDNLPEGSPQALFCRFPKGYEEEEVPFEFEDIPLP